MCRLAPVREKKKKQADKTSNAVSHSPATDSKKFSNFRHPNFNAREREKEKEREKERERERERENKINNCFRC